MPAPVPSSNSQLSGTQSVYYNKNVCQSFTQTLKTTLTKLSAYTCSEVQIFLPPLACWVTFYDNDDTTNGLSVSATTTCPTSFIFRGITNTSNLSAIASIAGLPISYRTQFYSGNTNY